MFKTKCGCPDCRGEKIPVGKWAWKGRTNKHGRMFGSCGKPGAKGGKSLKKR